MDFKNSATFDIFCTKWCLSSGGSKGGAREAPLLGILILSISCSFRENLAKSYVGVPPGELAPPPRENPGSVTVEGGRVGV